MEENFWGDHDTNGKTGTSCCCWP